MPAKFTLMVSVADSIARAITAVPRSIADASMNAPIMIDGRDDSAIARQ